MAGFKLFGPTQTLLTTSMQLHAARHEVLAANIANADTPNYRPRDMKFDGVLQALTHVAEPESGMRDGRLLLVGANSWHLRPGVKNALVTEEDEGEEKLDQNRVDLDREMTRFAENELLHETSVTLLSRLLGNLRYAIGEGKG